MATDRIITPHERTPDEEQQSRALRPETFGEYIGQPDLIERLRIGVQAARERGEPMEHVLLHGPPGLGKTTLAHVVATEMGTKARITSGPVLAKGTDLAAALMGLEHGDVLFIDEIHRMPVAVEEFIYPAMEDYRIDVTIDSGVNAQTVQMKCKPFTLIGATTRAGLLSAPLRSRFGMAHHLKYYSEDELFQIVSRSARLLGMEAPDTEALRTVAARSRGTPRIANRLLRRVRDFAQVKRGGSVDRGTVDAALALEGIDTLGLDELDRQYLGVIGKTYAGGPVGLTTVAATMNEDAGTLEDVVEPFLLQIGFLARTSRGRMLTQAAANHLGLRLTVPGILSGSDGELFER